MVRVLGEVRLNINAKEVVMESIKHANKVVGLKQVRGALIDGKAERVYIAEDAEAGYTRPVVELCGASGIEPVFVGTRKELGRACGVDVPTAVAAVLKG